MDVFYSKYAILVYVILIIAIAILMYLWLRPSSQLPILPTLGDRKTSKNEIILYYALWCGYSRMFLPEWEKFETLSKLNFFDLKISKVRCEDGDETTCLEKGIKGYPTVILYKGDEEIPYEGERTAVRLVEFVRKHISRVNTPEQTDLK